MRDDDRDRSVEFLHSGPGDGADEELVPPTGFPRLRRARLPLLVAGAVALIALVVVNVAAGPKGTPSAGPATVTVSPTPSSTTPSPTPSPDRSRVITLDPADGARVPSTGVTCPPNGSCAVLHGTPARLAAAIEHALPAATRLRTVTTLVHQDAPGSQLLTRTVTGRVGKAHVRIELVPAGAHDRLSWNASETAARTLVTVRDHVAGRLVSLRLVGRPGYHVAIGATRALAADRRLASLG